MARKKVNKPIVETDKPNGNPIKYWESAKAASDYYGINVVNISYNVNGTTKQAKGHYFRFASPKEIEHYTKITKHIETTSAVAAPVEAVAQTIPGPAPVLTEVIQPDENQLGANSPFARLLEEGIKKIKNNPK